MKLFSSDNDIRKGIGFLPLLLCLLPTVQTVTPLWSEPLLYGSAIGSVLCAFFCIYGLCRGKHLLWRLDFVDLLVFCWWLYVLVRGYMPSEVPCARQVVIYTSLFVLYLMLRLLFISFAVRTVAIESALFLVCGYELLLGVWQFCGGGYNSASVAIKGNFFNSGPYTAFISMGVAMAIVWLRKEQQFGGWKKSIMIKGNLFVLFVGMVMLALIRSRSAIVAVAVVLCWQYRGLIRKYCVYLTFMAIGIGAYLFFLKQGSALGRTFIWRLSLGMLTDNGWLGTGLGSFAGEYGKVLQTFFSSKDHIVSYAMNADVIDYAFCDILQVGVEQGWIGVIFCLMTVGVTMWRLRKISVVLLGGAVALVVFSLFSYSFQLFPYQMVMVVLMAKAAERSSLGVAFSGRKIALLCLPLCGVMGLCYHLANRHLQAHRSYKTMARMTHETFLQDYNRLLPLCEDDKYFLFDYAHLLRVNKHWMDSNAMLRRGLLVSNDPMFWVLMGNNHRDLGQYREAEICYDKAFVQMPNRIYPLYQKMCLYQQLNRQADARVIAKKILDFQEKVSSQAVSDMKKNAKKCLKSL